MNSSFVARGPTGIVAVKNWTRKKPEKVCASYHNVKSPVCEFHRLWTSELEYYGLYKSHEDPDNLSSKHLLTMHGHFNSYDEQSLLWTAW